MKMEYRILWIDDRIDDRRRDGHLLRIENFLTELGFVPQIVGREDDDGLAELLQNQTFDLILTDYNLAEDDTNGNIIIQNIREGNIFTEILLYSAVEDFLEIAKQIFPVDRLSYYQLSQGFNGLIDKTEKLITQTISKLQELTSMRGLMMAETSGLDSLMEELLIEFINRPEMDKKKVAVFEKTSQSSAKYFKEVAEIIEKCFTENRCEDFVKSSNVEGKWQILRQIVKDEKIENFSVDTLKAYKPEIIEIRNKLAHLKHTVKDGKHHFSFKASDGTLWEFNDGKCVDIRRNLKKHKDNFIALAKYLGVEIV